MRPRRLTLLVLATAVSAATGCSSSDEVVVTTLDDTTTLAPTTTPPSASTSTVSATVTTTTTPAAITTPTTTAVTTSTLTPSTTTSSSSSSSSTTIGGSLPPSPTTAYAVVSGRLITLDPVTGDPVRTIAEAFGGDGVFRGGLRLSPDSSTVWFSEGYEDGWFGCDTSVGSIGRVDVATGAVEIVATGTGAEPSPDGATVAYRDSAQCLPDPDNPEDWVLTPYDSVVVRDLATGAEQELVSRPAPASSTDPGHIGWVGHDPTGALVVLTHDGTLRRIDPAGSDVVQDHPVIVSDLRGLPVGTTGGALVTVEIGPEGSADVLAVDLATGAASLLASSETFLAVGVAPSGAIVVAGSDPIDVAPGAPVTVLAPADAGDVTDLDW